MAIAALIKKGPFKSLVTQNVDNLHRKSGVPNAIELHGNIQTEICSKCNKTFYRDYYVRPSFKPHSHNHMNGRHCDAIGCDGPLHDTLVFFGEPLNKFVKEKGSNNHHYS